MKTTYSYSAEAPQMIQSIGTAQKPLFQINFDTEEVQAFNGDESSSSGQSLNKQYRSLYVQVFKLDYSTLVSAIVLSRYSSSDIEALVLNNMEAKEKLNLSSSGATSSSDLTFEKATEYREEFNALQQWRQHAKAIAQSVMEGAQ